MAASLSEKSRVARIPRGFPSLCPAGKHFEASGDLARFRRW